MKIKAAILFTLTLATATTPVLAQTSNQIVQRPRVEAKQSLNLTLPSRAMAGESQPLPWLDAAPAARVKAPRRSIWPTVAGVAVGGLIGLYSGMSIALSDEPCQPNCNPRLYAAGALVIGGPILGGFIGHAIGKLR